MIVREEADETRKIRREWMVDGRPGWIRSRIKMNDDE
jgi:hypothetical protein